MSKSNYQKESSHKLLPEEWEGPTFNLAFTNFLFYILTIIVGGSIVTTGNRAIAIFGLSIFGLSNGFIWSLFTSIFIHASIAHLGFNLIYLLIFGSKLEENGFSDNAIYFAYFITGIGSGFFSLLIFFSSTSITLGASGAVFGLLGVSAGYEKKNNNPNYKRILGVSVILFLFSSSPNTNVFAHLFGLLFGFFLGYSNYHLKFEKQ